MVDSISATLYWLRYSYRILVHCREKKCRGVQSCKIGPYQYTCTYAIFVTYLFTNSVSTLTIHILISSDNTATLINITVKEKVYLCC